MRKNIFLGLFLAVILLAVSACGDKAGDPQGEDAAETSKAGQQKQAAAKAAQQELEGIPAVVAEVNGEEIPKAEFVETYRAQFQQMTMQAQASGADVDQDQLKKQVVDSMISKELLIQEADARDFSASEKDIRQTLTELAAQNGLESASALMEALEKQGMSREEVQTQVQVQVKVDQLIADEAGAIQPTEKELRALYDQMAAQQEAAGQAGQGGQAQLPSFQQARAQLVEQVRSQKEAEVAEALVARLRKDAEVVVNL